MSQQWTVNDVEKLSDDLTNQVEKVAGDLSKQVTHLAGQYGPQAWAAICGVKRVDSIGWIVAGLFSLVVGIVIARFIYGKTKGKKMWCEYVNEYGRKDSGPTNEFVIAFFGYGVAIAFSIYSYGPLMNAWNWVGAFYPALAVVHDLIGAALTKAGVQ